MWLWMEGRCRYLLSCRYGSMCQADVICQVWDESRKKFFLRTGNRSALNIPHKKNSTDLMGQEVYMMGHVIIKNISVEFVCFGECCCLLVSGIVVVRAEGGGRVCVCVCGGWGLDEGLLTYADGAGTERVGNGRVG